MTRTMTRTARKAVPVNGGGKPARGRRPAPPLVDFETLSPDRLEAMLDAGREAVECHRALAKGGSNVVAEVLPREGTFYELEHCPAGDIYDQGSHAQYYYHAHRKGEHGHFHTFLREAGMPQGVRPVEQSEIEAMRERDDKLSHLER